MNCSRAGGISLLSSFVVAGLPAQQQQQPAAPPPATSEAATPAITLLLTAPRKVDAAALRQRLAELLERDVAAAPNAKAPASPFVTDENGAIHGGAKRCTWKLVVADTPFALVPKATAHLEADDREAVLRQRAFLQLTCTSPTANGAARSAAYAVLGPVAAALLAADVCGVGAAHYGTFEPTELDDAEALRDSALDALEPTVTTSLVAFLRQRRAPNEAELQRALGAELKVKFVGDGDEEGDNFVVVREDILFVRIGEDILMLEFHDQDAKQRRANRKLPASVRDHAQRLQICSLGLASTEAEGKRRRLVARALAALWGDDVMGISWHCNRAMVPAGAATVDALRHVDPVAATIGGLVSLQAPRDEAALAAAVAKARAAWPQAAEELRAGGLVGAKFPFATGIGGEEHLWIEVRAVDDGLVRGIVRSNPIDVADVAEGTEVQCKLAELSDWFCMKDGKPFGNFTEQALQPHATPVPPAGDGKPPTGGK